MIAAQPESRRTPIQKAAWDTLWRLLLAPVHPEEPANRDKSSEPQEFQGAVGSNSPADRGRL